MTNTDFSKVKFAVDKTVERINKKLEGNDIKYIVEIQDAMIKNKKHFKLFLVVESGGMPQVLMDVPLISSKLEHKAEGYLQMFTILVDLGLQSLVIMTQEAIKKQKEKEMLEVEKESVIAPKQ